MSQVNMRRSRRSRKSRNIRNTYNNNSVNVNPGDLWAFKMKLFVIAMVLIIIIISMIVLFVDARNTAAYTVSLNQSMYTSDINSKLNFAKEYDVMVSTGDTSEDNSSNQTGFFSPSGIVYDGIPLEVFAISMVGEGKGSGTVSMMGDGGKAYGFMQYDYRYHVASFMKYAIGYNPEVWSGFTPYLGYANGSQALVGNTGIEAAFTSALEKDPYEFVATQLKYNEANMFDPVREALLAEGIDLMTRHVAVASAFQSVQVYTGAVAGNVSGLFNNNMTDEEMIRTLYAELRKGSFKKDPSKVKRFMDPNCEEQTAIDLLNGDFNLRENYTRANSYSGGWNYDKLHENFGIGD